jgi:hypothetical protein
MQLAGGAVGVDVDVTVKRHGVSSRGSTNGFKRMPFRVLGRLSKHVIVRAG